jgi:hypothetical protein
VKKLGSEKQSSLLCPSFSDAEKSFVMLVPGHSDSSWRQHCKDILFLASMIKHRRPEFLASSRGWI